jgi:integrase
MWTEEPVTVVSAVLGHSSVRTTLEAYAHFYEADKIEYLERVAVSI